MLLGTPHDNPQFLRFIHATGDKANVIIGKEFPCNLGISGWTFTHQESTLRNKLNQDPKHYREMDQATGSRSGEDSTLAIPIPLKGHGAPRGVIMFFKSSEVPFQEQDVIIAEKCIPKIRKILTEIDENYRQDMPTLARGDIQEQSILFCDIRHFNKIAKNVRLKNVVSLINEFYSRLLPCALNTNGELVKFLGDGMFIKFQLPSVQMSVQSALDTALKMKTEFDDLIKSWRRFGHPVTELNTLCIGISTGDTYSGLVGPPDSRQNELIGPNVNLSSHLCDKAKELGGGIVVCSRSASFIDQSKILVKDIATKDGPAHQIIPKN